MVPSLGKTSKLIDTLEDTIGAVDAGIEA